MKQISIDLETYSDADLSSCGVYRYAESPAFEILLFGYSIDGKEVKVIDLKSGETIPEQILAALTSPEVTKWAFNAAFERICLSAYLCKAYPERIRTPYLDPHSWKCSMVWSAYAGYPMSLEAAGEALSVKDQKMEEGKSLIRYFSVPCKPTKLNGGRIRNLPEQDPELWETFKTYNKRDVEAEMEIQNALSRYPVPEAVWEEYWLDQKINDRGIRIDETLVEQALSFDERAKEELTKEIRSLTGLDNPNSVQQLKGWIAQNGIAAESLDQKAVQDLIQNTETLDVKRALTIRQQLAKSSVKKYQAMEDAVCLDGRVHGMFQFYGASRTGRWAGRYINLQNLPQNHMEDLAEVRKLVREGKYDTVSMLYDSVPAVLSELIRTAFIPAEGYRFIVSDFSAIEARVLAWLAKEGWRVQAFREGKDIYCASASQMFHVPVEKHGINAELRQKGKIAELALGYGGSVGALKSMGALEMGLPEEELPLLVTSWRRANPKIVQLWWEIDRAVHLAVREREPSRIGGVRISCTDGTLRIQLPSGRSLSYVKPHFGRNRYGGDGVMYYGLDSQKRWAKIESYGPKFVENIVQAISRDILAFSMRTLADARISAHVHDELIIECPEDIPVEEITEKMCKTPPWASGLTLKAEGYSCEFYRKS
ncbi:MAG: DNA polymerase [Eubacterium sp.]|nr:DNA polymerase [Eubacterium sp.]